MTRSGARGQRLALRLALLLSAGVVVVLLVAGLLVNRVVSRSFEQALGDQQRERLSVAAAALVDLQARDAPRAKVARQLLLRRVADLSGGSVTLQDAQGAVVARAGRLPQGAGVTQTIEQPLISDGATIGRLVIEVPSRAEAAFLRLFNMTLLVAGIICVLLLVGLATLTADRLTRPLWGVAAAARRLGGGDLSARAAPGPDRESAELAGAFNAMAERLQQSETLRRRAASDIAHDLATPATVLESQLQAMVDGVVPADSEQLARAQASATALSGVIVQLGELAQAESAALARRPEAFDAGVLVQELASALEGLFRERGVRLELAVADALPVDLDRGQLNRALRNLVVNAVQHTPSGGTVRLSAGRTTGAMEIRVADQGPGIETEDLPHIFERFYRADRSRGAADAERAGSGIGLTIARELLAANAGSIRVERTGSDGTTFLVVVPGA
ncbi:MAG: ATP-binding protein [Chloroflexota bacterium]|nr:ATP-binding protein [Chloroflexota bacterium]